MSTSHCLNCLYCRCCCCNFCCCYFSVMLPHSDQWIIRVSIIKTTIAASTVLNIETRNINTLKPKYLHLSDQVSSIEWNFSQFLTFCGYEKKIFALKFSIEKNARNYKFGPNYVWFISPKITRNSNSNHIQLNKSLLTRYTFNKPHDKLILC